MNIIELKKLVDDYCQQHGVSFEVVLYMLRVVASDAENP